MEKIQVLGTGCAKCERLAENVRAALRELGSDCPVEKVSRIDEIASFGVMMTPALAIDGQVKLVGKVPSVAELKELLR
jgi:small redox-active disulfide protein 2